MVEIGSSYDGAIDDNSSVHDQMSPSFDLNPDQERQMARYQDLESQSETPNEASNAVEYSVSMTTKAISLVVYFLLSLGLTIQSKMLLGKFDFPYLLTAFHTGTTGIGCFALMRRGYFKPTKLGRKENFVLVTFSSLFTINIAISNVSLAMVSVAFHQILRSTVPLFTILIYRVYFSRTYSTTTYLALVPIILGVCMVTYGDYYFTVLGFSLTLLGVILAALKTIISNRLMTGSLALPALEILYRMSPLAAMQALLYSVLTGELSRFVQYAGEGNLTKVRILGLLSNSLIAFFLNLSSFHTNKIAGALTMTVCGNLKQVLTILLGILLFDVHVGVLSGMGMVITLGGAAFYSRVELKKKQDRDRAESTEKEILLDRRP